MILILFVVQKVYFLQQSLFMIFQLSHCRAAKKKKKKKGFRRSSLEYLFQVSILADGNAVPCHAIKFVGVKPKQPTSAIQVQHAHAVSGRPFEAANELSSVMSRSSSDMYQIPLRTLGRGRRQPVKKYSSSSSLRDDHARETLAEQANEDEDRLSTDETPLIPKEQVHYYKKTTNSSGQILLLKKPFGQVQISMVPIQTESRTASRDNPRQT
jgi:hypothetical protein